MTLVLIFQDGNGTATGSAPAGGGAATAVMAVHKRTGVTQPDVFGKSGAGLSMWGRLRGVRFG